MPILTTKDNLEVVKWSDHIENHYRTFISNIITKEFGNGPFSDFSSTNPILFRLLEGHLQQFHAISNAELSLAFYQYVQILHEQSNIIIINDWQNELKPEFDANEFHIYRRALRLILEKACELELIFLESLAMAKERTISKLEELLYICYKIYDLSNLIASQQLIEDAVEIIFDGNDQYFIQDKHHYQQMMAHLQEDLNQHIVRAVEDPAALNDLYVATKTCFDLGLDEVIQQVRGEQENMKTQHNEPFPCAMAFDLPSLIANLQHNYNVTSENATALISGLILEESNKCSIFDSVYKPHLLNKHLYRPILTWKIKDHAVKMILVGEYSLRISINFLAQNAIGWQKYPPEWKNDCFHQYVIDKSSKNDKVLEDHIESILNENNIYYDRNLKFLRKIDNHNLDINNDACGEIDFIFIENNTIYIADSKFLLRRYDFNNWKQDFYKFELDDKNFNATMNRKVQFLSQRKDLIQEHLNLKYPDESFDFSQYSVEGIFIINTPTFYMYNSSLKIYTLKTFDLLLKEQFNFPEFKITLEKDGTQQNVKVNHPYFKIPTYPV